MNEQQYLLRCIQLAKLGQGHVAPNPMVGAVIVHGDQIIGEGWHHKFGSPHAEIDAIKNVAVESLLTASTLFVNLEPCCHEGKTPPCTKYIISKGIPRVVIGMTDPYSEVNGAGIRELQTAGVQVITNVCEAECRDLNKRFITFHRQNRPYIILKWAESADGFIGKENEKITISNLLSQLMVHRWRSEEAGVLVGTKTVLTDNPQLNTRQWFGNQPVRITIDKNNVIPGSAYILDGKQPSLIYTLSKQVDSYNVTYEKIDKDQDLLPYIMKNLYQRNIQSILVEGGAKLLQSFIDAHLYDEVRVFHSPLLLYSGINAPTLPDGALSEEMIGNNRLTVIKCSVE